MTLRSRYAVAPTALLIAVAACSSGQSSSTSPSPTAIASADQGDETSPASPSPSPEPDPVDELAMIFPEAIITRADPVNYWGILLVVTFPAEDYQEIPGSRLGEWLAENFEELDGLGLDGLLFCNDEKPVRSGGVIFKLASLVPFDSRDAEVVLADQEIDAPGKTTVHCGSLRGRRVGRAS